MTSLQRDFAFRVWRLGAAIILLATVSVGLEIFSRGVQAHSYKLGDIAVGHVWAPPPGAGAEGLPVYGPILNGGHSAVRLVGAWTSAAEKAHFRIVNDREVKWPEALELRPGEPFALAAWREHIWSPV